jgi:tripartite-type tricarboxylate transporter receptor subunit TctC
MIRSLYRARWTPVLALLFSLPFCLPAAAQEFPSKALRVVVPWPAGGLVDVAARLVGVRLQAALGQAVVIDNKVGAGGVIGADLVAKAPADGHTLVFTTSALTINAALRAKLPFDVVKDFDPVALVAYAPSVLVVSPTSGLNTVKDLVALVKSKPGKISYASAGIGSPAHLSGELFKSLLGLDALHIPYTGAPAAMNDQIAGRIDFQFANMTVALPQIRAGKVRALAVTSAKRFAALPDLPTMAEAAAPTFEADQWLGFLAPHGTPRSVVDRLASEVNKALASDEVRAAYAAAGMTAAVPGSPAAFEAYLKTDLVKWSGVVKSANIQPE